ncbi:MAG: hypothetical protein HY222_06425 [Thaumarchaeota archaeon]|nr:hypothetical protein [Nitrososphaerota archaeon]MBI3642009.1 hypothetical protein [Nitrososphaerota archaeon]
MVKQIEKDICTLYLCEACGLGYQDVQTAQKCEEHCTKFNSCSLGITRYAVLK